MFASLQGRLFGLLAKLWNAPRHQPVFIAVEATYLVQAYYVAAALGVADLINEKPSTCAELAARLNVDAGALDRVLRTLAAFRVFTVDRHDLFHMTRRARVLLSDGADSLRSWLTLMGSPELCRTRAMSLEAVRTGRVAFELAHQTEFYQYLAEHAPLHSAFSEAMGRWTALGCRALVRACDLGRFAAVADIGGGDGIFLEEALRQHPRLQGVLLESSESLALARARCAAAGIEGRCQFVNGSFFAALPGGVDAYVLKHVLRDWDDARVVAILEQCRAALPPWGRLFLIDAIVDPHSGADRLVKLLDLQIGSLVPGGLRTRRSIEELLSRAGLQIVGVRPTGVPDSAVIEAKPS